MNDINFECTACGKCCHYLRLALTIAEAIVWLERGGHMERILRGDTVARGAGARQRAS